jgi:gamma-glutamyltranspeptidase
MVQKKLDKLNDELDSLLDDEENVTESENPMDVISVDVPLFIRLMEYAREDAKTDMDLHNVTEMAIKLSSNGKTLGMAEYEEIVGTHATNQQVAEAKRLFVRPDIKNKNYGKIVKESVMNEFDEFKKFKK